jgi:hypothetical protein
MYAPGLPGSTKLGMPVISPPPEIPDLVRGLYRSCKIKFSLLILLLSGFGIIFKLPDESLYTKSGNTVMN